MSHVKQMFHKILLNILSFVGTQQIEISCKSLTERLMIYGCNNNCKSVTGIIEIKRGAPIIRNPLFYNNLWVTACAIDISEHEQDLENCL